MSMVGRMLGRHQVGAAVATAVDFSTMVVLVSAVGLPPAAGTAFGAACGGVVNFFLSRRWIFDAAHHRVLPQAGRYAAISLVSLLLNASGVHFFASILRVQYVLARLVVAVAVSLLWNFPLHRAFVFGGHER